MRPDGGRSVGIISEPVATRRQLLGVAGAAVVGSAAGCAGSGDDGAGAEVDVVAGPDGRLRFEPETLTVPAGTVVTWGFDSAGHNVSGRPGHSGAVQLPADAEPFASYGPDASPLSTMARGETYEHRFAVPGRYVYSCVPHESSGMLGRVEVEA